MNLSIHTALLNPSLLRSEALVLPMFKKVIAPNIIVLNRLRKDFDGLKIVVLYLLVDMTKITPLTDNRHNPSFLNELP